jgi:hypothetical protein
MDARGPMEARVLGVERGCNQMDRDLEALKRQLVALSQGIWDAWSDVATPSAGPPAPPPTPTVHITPCSGLNVLYNLPFVDSIFGSGTLVWDGTAHFAACLSGLAYGGSFACATATIAIHYSMDTSGNLVVTWLVNSGSHCPITSTCSSTTNATSTPSASTNCGSVPAQITFTMGSSANELALRAGHASQTIVVQLPT